jgi:DNA-binding SARP family transcriptional activator
MEPLIDRMRACLRPQRRFEAAHYHHLMGWYLSLCNRYDEALIHCHEALVAVKHSAAVSPAAFVYTNIAQVLLLAGRPDEAELYLAPAMKIIERHGCVLARYEHSFALAALALQRGNKQESVRAVRHTFEWARRLGYWSYTYPHPEILQALCAFALREDIESDCAVSMIRRSGVAPPADAPAAWPWPVKIETLGRFRIEKEGIPLTFSGKVQKKPLELLKALISFGGTDVPEERIAEALWPDVDGDTGHRSFETTLYRLRKLIGDRTLKFQDGLLSLDKRHCWTDAWSFEHSLDKAETLAEGETAGLTKKAIALYKGHFLPSEAGQPWSVSLRERLRDRFARLVVSMGVSCENKGEWEEALRCFQKGLDIDDLTEEFYRHAMTCQIRLGRHAQAVTVFKRCRSALARALGIEPSPKTAQIYNALAGAAGEPLPRVFNEQG